MDLQNRQASMQRMMEDSINLLEGLRSGKPLDEIQVQLRLRDRDLRQFFAEPIPEDMRTEIIAWVQSIQAIDQEAVLAIQSLKTAALDQLGAIRSGLLGARAYQDTLDHSF